MTRAKTTSCRIATALGSFVVEVDHERAPTSAANFVAYVGDGLLDGSSVYRIVAPQNQGDDVPVKIAVVQFGLQAAQRDFSTPFPPIRHETTEETGLRHVDGTLSMARLAPGTASSAFFICIGDQPELDFGGQRHPDQQGFAAFGRVTDGMDVVRAIYGRAEPTGPMQNPIPITRVVIVAEKAA